MLWRQYVEREFCDVPLPLPSLEEARSDEASLAPRFHPQHLRQPWLTVYRQAHAMRRLDIVEWRASLPSCVCPSALPAVPAEGHSLAVWRDRYIIFYDGFGYRCVCDLQFTIYNSRLCVYVWGVCFPSFLVVLSAHTSAKHSGSTSDVRILDTCCMPRALKWRNVREVQRPSHRYYGHTITTLPDDRILKFGGWSAGIVLPQTCKPRLSLSPPPSPPPPPPSQPRSPKAARGQATLARWRRCMWAGCARRTTAA